MITYDCPKTHHGEYDLSVKHARDENERDERHENLRRNSYQGGRDRSDEASDTRQGGENLQFHRLHVRLILGLGVSVEWHRLSRHRFRTVDVRVRSYRRVDGSRHRSRSGVSARRRLAQNFCHAFVFTERVVFREPSL